MNFGGIVQNSFAAALGEHENDPYLLTPSINAQEITVSTL
jgi:hypothetical protein